MTPPKRAAQLKFGFTLIELMVVMMIMSLLFGLGYANFRDFQRRQILEDAGRQLKADLRYAQELALAGRKPDNLICTASVLHGYQIRRTNIVSGNAGGYAVEAVCSSGQVEVKRVTFNNEIKMRDFGSGNTALFKSVSGGLDQDSSISISLTFTSAGINNYVITISPSGEIND